MIEIIVSNEKQKVRKRHPSGPIRIGRNPSGDGARLVIDDSYVSRSQLLAEQVHEDHIKIENLGAAILFGEGDELARGESRTTRMPIRISAGFTMIEFALIVEQEDASHAGLHTISRPVQSASTGDTGSLAMVEIDDKSPTASQLTGWFEKLLQVQQSAAGSREFYQETAEAIVEMINLDRGLVLLRHGEDWEITGRHSRIDTDGALFSRTVLTQVVDQRRTFFRGITKVERERSLIGIEAVVASPIFDADNDVIGAVYGTRYTDQSTMTNGIRPIEAQLVQLLAGAVSSGLARVEKEEEAARTRVQFEQFFSRKLVTELQRNPTLLDGHDREITVLFCDLRKFSIISERLGARQVYELLGEMMDSFTNVVMDHGGVIVDYHGDGLAAMWNAPTDEEMHAERACEAALAMLDQLKPLDDKWGSVCGFPLSIGIGINTGNARVGNAGSRRRMKYGPLGHTVNLASRLEGVTKRFSTPLLITEATRSQLQNHDRTRRLCSVLAFGMESPVSIYEYCVTDIDSEWNRIRDEYERAFSLYEHRDLPAARVAAEKLSASLATKDSPTEFLLARITEADSGTPETFDPILHMTTK